MYLCTNGVLLEEKLPLLKEIPSRGLRDRLFINVHLDGMEATHDAMVERPGVFSRAVEGIRAAKAEHFHVYTNTTVYRRTRPHELVVLFDFLSELGVDGMMLSPAYQYAAVREENAEEASGESIFMSREEIHRCFQEARPLLRRFPLVTSPVYLDFLCGKSELPCAAWANPTRNVRGWKAPCYLITDRHYRTYDEMIEATDWSAFGPEGDRRCRDCLVHCGFEPAAVLASKKFRNLLRMALWQLT
jgi:hopanoid biosynthesis associated radical SAM protein HpnH